MLYLKMTGNHKVLKLTYKFVVCKNDFKRIEKLNT